MTYNKTEFPSKHDASSTMNTFFVVGAAKAGTTWLYSQLGQHPEVHVSPVKEPHFFAPPVEGELDPRPATDTNVWKEVAKHGWVHSGWICDPANYERLLQAPPGALATGEATVAYLHAPGAPAKIAHRFPDARIIVIVREPVSRALSHLRMDMVQGRVRYSEEAILRQDLNRALSDEAECCRYISRSLYSAAIQRYIERFGRDSVIVLKFDDIRSSADWVLAYVADRLGIAPDLFPNNTVSQRNSGRDVRWPALNRWLVRTGGKDWIRRAVPRPFINFGKRFFYSDPDPAPLSPHLLFDLRSYFEPDIRWTADITGLDLSAWLRHKNDNERPGGLIGVSSSEREH